METGELAGDVPRVGNRDLGRILRCLRMPRVGNREAVINRKLFGISGIRGGIYNPRYKSEVVSFHSVRSDLGSKKAKGGRGVQRIELRKSKIEKRRWCSDGRAGF